MAVVSHLLQKLLRPKNKKETVGLPSLPSSPAGDAGSCTSPASSSSSSPSSSSHHQSNMLRLVFAEYDTDGDGQISLSESVSVVRAVGTTLGNSGDSESEAAAMMDAVDTDADGLISFDEFLCLVQGTPENQDDVDDLRSAFAVYDQNGDGVITAEELHCVLRRLMSRSSEDGMAAPSVFDCRRMIVAVDVDGDGVVSFHEFAAMMGAVAAR